MPTNPNKLSKFWQELKRRNVVRVVTIYAGAAFVILELLSIIIEPLQLPEWTLQFAIVFLIIGFIIAIILSWIYDIHPDGGMVKTEPVEKVEVKDILKSSNSWRIASYISFVVIIALIILNVIPRAGRSAEKAILVKSIAVLPFINDSPDEEKMYFINGTMESILDNLCKIHDLRVVSRTSVEQYRNNLKPVQEIAREMNVSYVLEGSGMKDGENIRLTIQLIDAINDRHIWSDSYHRKTDEIFSLQSEIAQLVAGEIEAIISPEEKQLIDKIPTTSLTAYDLYQQGREAVRTYRSGFGQEEAALRAESLYRRSLQHDSTFAQAYLGLASIYSSRLRKANNPILDENLIDSSLFYINTALSYDDQLADAYIYKGYYHSRFRESKQALKMWEKAISINPNATGPYTGMGWLYFSEGDFVKSIASFVKANSLDRGPDLPANLQDLGFALTSIGFFTEAKQAYLEALNLDGDSSFYYLRLSYVEYCAANYEKAIEASHNARSSGSKDPESWSYIGCSYLYLGQYEEALDYLQKFTEELESLGQANPYYLPWIAYAYLQNGYTEESEKYVSEQINMAEEWFRNRISGMEENYLRLAIVYAVIGENDKAYENLSLYRETGHTSVNVVRSRNEPMFEKIRDEPEFDQIMTDLETIYQAEHERVRQWLEENEIL